MGSAEEWRINCPFDVATGVASNSIHIVMKATSSTKTKSFEASLTGKAPRQKQSPQLQSDGTFELCSSFSGG